MRVALIAAVYALCLSSVPVLADEPVTTTTSGVPDAEHIPVNNPASQVVCLRRIHEGTVTNAVDCRTQRTWDRIRRENQQAVSIMQLRSLTARGM
ncbi:MAG: hypothetical protein HY243_01545 [Proteobacteria bacterium]|nr:hypothetical protein [Pseudomonadota bacterium]